ncbi:MAG: glucose-6-phosphate isomerase, partial [Gammaproteobacteria bacterium]|nr:glucose-6-phosphate isomerase [Gammaproteobacteria bacterium]
MKKQKKTIWNQLTELAEQQKQQSILSLFDDTERAKKYSFQFEDFYIDFSKQNLSDDAFEVLLSLAEVSEIKDKIQQLFDGGIVNKTECRSALHHLLRQPIDETSDCEISNHHLELLKEIEQSKVKIETIVKQLHDRQWLGSTGKSITDVIAIGVGGSDLGPYMVTDALSEFTHPKAKDINVHFVSNMDGTQLDRLIQSLNPETTLVIISSKSFTTSDTLYNAETARNWMTAGAQNKADIFARHFIGISTNASKMTEWGIAQENQIPMWEWVGGRYSFWSAIGLPIAIKIGFEAFKDLLAGAHAIDIHFSTTELKENIPFLTGLIAVWNATFLNINAHSVLPYDGRLKLLPNYLTQLEMESNGKRVDNQGNQIDYKTCPILWGDVGTNAQHAFYQLL